MNTPRWTTLVQAEDVAETLRSEDLVVVDCRFVLAAPEQGEGDYRQGHLPGARYAHMDRDLSGPARAGAGRHPWPEAGTFARRLAAWGIGPRSRVLAYDAGDGAFAARLWFLLRAAGHDQVAVLDGGWTRWTALGLPVDTAPGPPPASGPVRDLRFDQGRLLDAQDVRRHLARGGVLVDARTPERFRGEVEPIDAVAGHVPGAVNRPYLDNLEDGRFKSPDALRAGFLAVLAGREPGSLVAMCGSGVTACHHLLAMERAGLAGARLYTGSWSGWIADPTRPVAIGPD